MSQKSTKGLTLFIERHGFMPTLDRKKDIEIAKRIMASFNLYPYKRKPYSSYQSNKSIQIN